MVEKDTTTIKIGDNTKKDLDSLKVHPRQPYDEVILMLIKYWLKNKK